MLTFFRKALAYLLQLVFIAVIAPLLIVQSFSGIFLHKQPMVSVVIPGSFDSVMGIIAEQIAKTPEEAILFETRLKNAIHQDEYASILAIPVELFFDHAREIEEKKRVVVDLTTMKEKMRHIIPTVVKRLSPCLPTEDEHTFRVCIPSSIKDVNKVISMATTSFMAHVPPQVELQAPAHSLPDAVTALFTAARTLTPLTAAAIITFFLILIALLIFSPWSSVLKALGVSITSLGVILGLFIYSTYRLISPEGGLKAFTSGQLDFIHFIASHAFADLLLWTYATLAIGIGLLTLGFTLARKK